MGEREREGGDGGLRENKRKKGRGRERGIEREVEGGTYTQKKSWKRLMHSALFSHGSESQYPKSPSHVTPPHPEGQEQT